LFYDVFYSFFSQQDTDKIHNKKIIINSIYKVKKQIYIYIYIYNKLIQPQKIGLGGLLKDQRVSGDFLENTLRNHAQPSQVLLHSITLNNKHQIFSSPK